MLGTHPHTTTPIQLYHLATDQMECELQAPVERLQDVVHYHWVLRIEATKVDLPIVPDNAVDLVMSPDVPNFSVVYPPATAAFSIPLEGPVTYVGTCFRMDRVESLLGAAPGLLRELVPGPETTDALGLSPLGDELLGQRKPADIVSVLDTFWSARLSTEVHVNSAPPLATLLDHADADCVETLARAVGMSERQLRRATTQRLGLAPKKIQRVTRMQTALRELLSPGVLEQARGFYDDAHRIRELRALTGLTPGQLRRLAEKYNRNESALDSVDSQDD